MRQVSEEQLSVKIGNGMLRLYSFTSSSHFALTVQDASTDAIAILNHPEDEEVGIIKSVDNMAVVVSGISLEDLEILSASLGSEIAKLKSAQNE